MVEIIIAEVVAAVLQSSDMEDKAGASEPDGFDSGAEKEYQNNWDPFEDGYVYYIIFLLYYTKTSVIVLFVQKCGHQAKCSICMHY